MRALLSHWVLTASLLIAAVLLLRAAFGRRISARLRYALWALVLLRLLIPVPLFTAPAETVLPEIPVLRALPSTQRATKAPSAPHSETPAPAQTLPAPDGGAPSGTAPAGRRPLDPLVLLEWTWLAGSLGMALALLGSNLRFARRLRRVRVPLAGTTCPLPVYLAAGLPSPCLFGTVRPAVYLIPEAESDPVLLRHALAHETTHFRQGDHIWSLLRCAALAVHWWNPLVWLAAVLSRRDAELACDEGTLKALGSGERRAYGDTLLTLVTASPRPGDLLCCATTMVGGKRSLRERITRIARAPKRWLWAAILAGLLAALVCACSFAKTAETHPDGPLTEEELQAFNTEVFNGGGFNMMNQFLYQAVEAPKDYRQIDLFQLFYNGTGRPMEITEEERRAVAEAGYSGEDPMVDLIKCPAAEMDAVLREYVGLGLEETDKWGLDLFTYLPEYDAYYDFHGDTNYPGEVAFTSGEWKDGKVLLYYEGSGFPGLSSGNGEMNIVSSGLACVTLEPQKNGGYHFLTNWRADPPAVPTAYPDWEPERVIPLDQLEPYTPEALTVTRHSGDVAEVLYRTRFEPDEFRDDGFDVEVYRSTDGGFYASVVVSETERDCFWNILPDDGWDLSATNFAGSFTDLFDHSGVVISYYGWLDERYYGEFHDHFTFTDSGEPSLLLQAKGEVRTIDLDGDGEMELTSDGGDASYLFFRRDGRLYQAEVHNLVREAWPEAGYMTFGFWDWEDRFLPCAAEVPVPGADFTVTAYRDIYFDGENLRIYKDESGYTDHVKNGVDAPAEVLAAARDLVEAEFQALAAKGYGADGSGNYDEGNFGSGNVVWDDWRITGLNGPYFETAGDLQAEIWNVSYETHTTTPDRVVLAGGSYIGEDGWSMIGYPGCSYLYFQLDEAGNRTYLFSLMENDCSPGSDLFREDMLREIEDRGLLTALYTD